MGDVARFVVGVAVSTVDPVIWVIVIVGVAMSRKWWVAVGLGIVGVAASIGIVKALNPYPTPQDMPTHIIVVKLVAGILVGFIAFGIATWIRRRKQAAKPST